MTLLWLLYESWGLLKPTRGSPDVVNLIKYALRFFRSPFNATKRFPLKKKDFQLNALWSSQKGKSDKNWMSFKKFRKFPIQWTQKSLYLVQKWLRKVSSKIPTLPQKETSTAKFLWAAQALKLSSSYTINPYPYLKGQGADSWPSTDLLTESTLELNIDVL